MKYLVSWTFRPGGSPAESEVAAKRALQVFGKWSPPADATFHAFLSRVDGAGGFALVESDNLRSVMEGPAKFGPWFDFQVVPVVDVAEGVQIATEGIEFRDSIR